MSWVDSRWERQITRDLANVAAALAGTSFAKAPQCMLRITPQRKEPPSMMVEGQLVGPWVEELRRTTIGAGPVSGLFLDLRYLTFADAEGVTLLRQLRAAGAELGMGSEFLTALIGGEEREG